MDKDGVHRLDLGLLQQDVARILEADESTITNWEINNTFPRHSYNPAIVKFLGYWPYDIPARNLGQQIVTKRTKLGLSQKELAHHLGVDPSTLGRWEHNGGQPLLKHRKRLMAFLSSQVLDENGKCC